MRNSHHQTGPRTNIPVKISPPSNIAQWEKRNRRESDYLQDRGVLVCQVVPLCLSYSSILLDWVAVNKGSTCFCTDLAFCSDKPLSREASGDVSFKVGKSRQEEVLGFE